LFNHPNAFSDQPAVGFDRSAYQGTPMETPEAPIEIARKVVTELNQRAEAGAHYTLQESERIFYTRDFVFATVKKGEATTSMLFDVDGSGGTIRGQQPRAESKPVEPAPFAIGTRNERGPTPKGGKEEVRPKSPPRGEGANAPLLLADSLSDKVKSAIPKVLESKGFSSEGEITITSVPDLSFVLVDASGRNWIATYNALNGTVAGRPEEPTASGESISPRRFLTRLHLAHGYPNSGGPRWYWALIVDAMAFIMVFWGLSGLLMWWQIKATRKIGILMLLLSAGVATWLGISMYGVIRG
jgi:hypothetical protein